MRLGSGAFAAGCVVIEVLGVALFLRGFFPAPVRSSSRTEHQTGPAAPEPSAGASSNWTKLPPPLFSKVVIMLIDALRDDFVFGSKGVKFMPYTTYLVEKGPSRSFVAEAKPPTVTMPRIKAMMTGRLPGFVDVIRNLNSPALLEDNIITQAKEAGKRIIFYGDETWVKLFPKHFVEYDGTTSFFVSDYTEEREAHPPSLLVLCGDHGMSEHGGHGASSLEEVNTALLFISSAFKRKPGDVRPPARAQQTDLAATLAIGLGLPIPKHSVGHLLFPVVEGRAMREQLRFLHLNTVQLSRLLQENVPSYEREPGFEQFRMSEKLHGNWVRLYLEENNSEVLLNLGTKVRRQYLDALKALSLALSRQVAHYDIYSMVVGTVVVLEVLALLLLSIPQALGATAELEVPLSSPLFSLLFYLMFLLLWATHVVVCTSAEGFCYLCSLSWPTAGSVMVLVSVMFCAVVSALTRTCVDGQLLRRNLALSSSWSELSLLILAGTVGHALSLGASSFVEEEHQTWYFLLSTLCLALGHRSYRDCFLRDGREPQRCSHVEGASASVAPALQDKSTGCDVLEVNQEHKSLSSLDTLPGHEKCMMLAGPWLILGCCRLLRSLNQTGVQWAHRPDLGHWLTSSDHKAELSVLAALSLIAIFVLVQGRCSQVSRAALALGLLGVYCYRAAIGQVLSPWQRGNKDISRGIIEARCVYVSVLGILFTGTRGMLQSCALASDVPVQPMCLWDVHSGLVLLAALLFRPHNLPVLVCSLLTQTMMARFVWRPLRHTAVEVAAMHYWFGQAFFYFQGNSNNIATVDISAGFVGLSTYVEIPAMFLTAFATYTGPVLWASHLVNFLSAEPSRSSALRHACFCYALVGSIPVAAYIILVTALRYHLFIWSVFSPKLLYEGTRLLITAALCVCFTAVGRASAKADLGKIAINARLS
ncbi:PREDICTED: GPI ethanolamine phosphate transferase 2 isoform X2 [Miniopterus natalensis]|uniref:GPI ethanolamine phosphate transferase 2 isoform X2 n=1 Tax=Miniopterus natalensis TaxID=291302 RepID=UPI0007A6CCEC|nr:PREDICTED: GPI ethanolamine phosphate transferase 2 isoform X2 [Miniopterus natalensis]